MASVTYMLQRCSDTIESLGSEVYFGLKMKLYTIGTIVVRRGK